MKKILKGLTKTISMVLIALVLGFGLVACKGSNTEANHTSSVQNQGSTSNGNIYADDVSNGDGFENEEDENAFMFSGMFEFNRDLSFEDIYFEDLNELTTHFKTKDLNGVYYAAKNRGFDKFTKDITTEADNDSYYAIYFGKDGKVMTFIHDGYGAYTKLANGAYDFEYSYENGAYVATKDNFTFNYDAENGTLKMFFRFVYEENSREVASPLFVTETLTLTANSEDMFEGTEYAFDKTSAVLTTTETNPLTLEERIKTLGNFFRVTAESSDEIITAIMDKLSASTLLVSDDAARIVTKTGETYEISVLENDLFTLFGARVAIESHTFDFASKVDSLQFVVTVDGSTSFTFSFNKVA